MDPSLPTPLRAAVDALCEGRSGRTFSERAAQISQLYRANVPSSRVVTTETDALAYALTRMPATYAAVRAALQALAERAPLYEPISLLDMGCGPGTAAWAALDAFPMLTSVSLVDASRPFLDLAQSLAPSSESEPLRNAKLSIGDLASPPGEADLVTVAYALTELAEDRAIAAAERLWDATRGVLLIVEPGTPEAWRRLMRVRSILINIGGEVLAPCPHGAPCPLAPPDWCHVSQRLPRSRAHIAAKGATAPYEDEKFAYLAVARPEVTADLPRSRVLAPPLEDKAGLTLKLCTQDGRLETRRVTKRDKPAFKIVRKARWGDTV